MARYDVFDVKMSTRHTIELTHTDRVLFPGDGITKGDLIAYYRSVAETMLPHVQGRPLHLQRFPGGIGQAGFVQKEASEHWPDWIERVIVEKEGGSVTHALCNNTDTLIFLANQNCITPHVWLSCTDNLDRPDRMIFDLDPAEDDFEVVRSAVRILHGLLEEIGLPGYLMTTGSRGLHVAVPLRVVADFDTVRAFARDVAAVLVQHAPDRLTTEPRKEQRRGRLYIDTLRNAYGQTTVAPYAVRARAGAPVATPLEWEELNEPGLTARAYTLRNVLERLDQKADPWRSIGTRAVALTEPRQHLNALRTYFSQ